jgi:hypothetical protein
MLAALRVAPVPAAPLDGLRALRSSELQGRDEEQGFPVRTRNWIKGKGGQRQGHSQITGQSPDGEAERKRLSEEEQGASIRAIRQTIRAVSKSNV